MILYCDNCRRNREIEIENGFFTCMNCYVKKRFFPKYTITNPKRDNKISNLFYFQKLLDAIVSKINLDGKQNGKIRKLNTVKNSIYANYEEFIRSKHFTKINGRYFIFRELLNYGIDIKCPLTSVNGRNRNKKKFEKYTEYKIKYELEHI